MNLVERAFAGILPGRKLDYACTLKYSGHLKGYNANIRLNKLSKTIEVKLGKNWRFVDDEIKIGLLQELLLRLFRHKARTLNTDLYNNFMRSLPSFAPKTESHPVLEQSFSRVNEKYFLGILDRPNLKIGAGTRTLGCYDFSTDTITISSVLLPRPDLLDYVMYHELLHKKQKFHSRNGRHFYHSKAFRQCEKAFENSEEIEKELNALCRKHRRRLFGLL